MSCSNWTMLLAKTGPTLQRGPSNEMMHVPDLHQHLIKSKAILGPLHSAKRSRVPPPNLEVALPDGGDVAEDRLPHLHAAGQRRGVKRQDELVLATEGPDPAEFNSRPRH